MRRYASFLLVVAFLVGLLLASSPSVVAQGVKPVFRIQVNALDSDQETDGKDAIRKSLGAVDLTYVVTFQCLTSQDEYGDCSAPLSDQRFDIQVTEAGKANYPKGWKVAIPADRTSFSMTAGDTETVPVNVKLETDAPDKDYITILIRVVGEAEQAPPTLPIPGQSSSNVCTCEGSDTIRVEKILTFSENAESVFREYRLPLIGGAIVLFLATAILVRGRKKTGQLVLTSDSPRQTLAPGRGASFPIRVENQSRDNDRVRFVTSNLPPGWVAIVPLDEVDLSPGASTQLWVTVRAPANAYNGQAAVLDLRATSQKTPGREARLPLEASVASPPDPILSASPPEETPSSSETSARSRAALRRRR